MSLVMVFAALIVYFNYTTAEYVTADAIRADVYGRQELINTQKDAIAQVKKLILDYSGTAQLRDVVSLALPLTLDQSGVFHQVESMAALNKLAVQSFTISAPVSQNVGSVGTSSTAIVRPIGNMTFQFRVIGTYEDFKNFLSNLETNIRVFDVRNLSVDPLAKPNQDFYGFDLTVVTYYQNS